VHPAVIGRRIEVVADLNRVRVFNEGHLVADHQRVWAWHQTLTDPDHLTAANTLRRAHIGALRPVHDPDAELRSQLPVELRVEQRPLTDYDTVLGIDLDSSADPSADGGVAS
jgi:hypothetical protein